eukprot:95450_1
MLNQLKSFVSSKITLETWLKQNKLSKVLQNLIDNDITELDDLTSLETESDVDALMGELQLKIVPHKKLKRAILTLIRQNNNNQPEQEDKKEYDSDDDCCEEAFIDPSDQTRRQPIWETSNANDAFITCIGSLRIEYTDKNKLTNTEIRLGSATIIDVDDNANCFVLTAAHNAFQFLRYCASCNIKTTKVRCGNCYRRCPKTTPRELIKATKISFTRRCIVKKITDPTSGEETKFGDPLETYDIEECMIREELYEKHSTGKQGYDICIMRFKCKDSDHAITYKNICCNIKLISDETFGSAFRAQLNIFGYPGDKVIDKRYKMYGMSTGMDGHKFQVATNDISG